MTSKFKCPVCQNNLHKINIVVSTCTNDKCKLWGSSIPNLVLKALMQAKQDLEIATNALREICNDYQEDSTERAEKALTQIEHKEQI